MNSQRSQKGRLSAATQLEEVGRRKNRAAKRTVSGRQQFGGIGSVPRLDRGVERLSRRAIEAIQRFVTNRKAGSGGGQ